MSDRDEKTPDANKVRSLLLNLMIGANEINSLISNELMLIAKEKKRLYTSLNNLSRCGLSKEDKALVLFEYLDHRENMKIIDSIIENIIFDDTKDDLYSHISAGIILGQMSDRSFRSDLIGEVTFGKKDKIKTEGTKMGTTRKICTNCKHCVSLKNNRGENYYGCSHPEIVSIVDESPIPCQIERGFDGSYADKKKKCGFNGKLFEPKI